MDLKTGDGRLVHGLLQPFREERMIFRMRDLVAELWREIHVCQVSGR